MNIYKENILDHYEHPRNFGHIHSPDVKVHDSNSLCGDSFDFELKFDRDIIKEVKFSGHGCAISTATCSMLSERFTGQSVESVTNFDKAAVLKMLGIELGHVRIKCALLPLKILKKGIYEHLKKQ